MLNTRCYFRHNLGQKTKETLPSEFCAYVWLAIIYSYLYVHLTVQDVLERRVL